MKTCKFQVVLMKDGTYYLYIEIFTDEKCEWNDKTPCKDMIEVFILMSETINMAKEIG